jgi:hypothetical protein
MIVRKILIAAAALALTSTTAWALPSRAPSNRGTAHAPTSTPVGPPSATPNNSDNPGSANRHRGAAADTGSSTGNGRSGSHGNSGGADTHGDSRGADTQKTGGQHGKSHRCAPHRVGYVAAGSLESQTLIENSDGAYSGELEVLVARVNHHAVAAKGKAVKYAIENVHVTFGLSDTNADGSVGLDDIAKGDRVQLIGRITVLAKKCSQGEFTPVLKIHRIVFHAPPPPMPPHEN